jgi:hypothetical protein
LIEEAKMMENTEQEIAEFLAGWPGEGEPLKEWFVTVYKELAAMEGVFLSFVGRPGVSYSLRPRHRRQNERSLFAIVDVIDDDPQQRWLSVCFYGDMISDPDGRGEVIPGGLAGSDGYCFDMAEDDPAFGEYLRARLQEAAAAAAAGR